MSPDILFAGGESVHVKGNLGVKRQYGLPEIKVYPVIADSEAAKELRALEGQVIISMVGDGDGEVDERGSGRRFGAEEKLRPYEGQKFILAKVELEG